VAIDVAAPQRLLTRFRQGTPAVIGRVADDVVLLDLRTVEPEDDVRLERAVRMAMEGSNGRRRS